MPLESHLCPCTHTCYCVGVLVPPKSQIKLISVALGGRGWGGEELIKATDCSRDTLSAAVEEAHTF